MRVGLILRSTTVGDHFAKRVVAAAKSLGTHASRWSHNVDRLPRIGDTERIELGTETPAGLKRLEFFRFTVSFVALANVDERWNGGIPRSQRVSDPRTDVWSSHVLRWLVACVPMILMPRMQNDSKVSEYVRSNQRPAIEDAGDFLKAFADLDTVYGGLDRRKGAENIIRFHSWLEWRISFRIERFCMCHASRHPEDNDRICGRWECG